MGYFNKNKRLHLFNKQLKTVKSKGFNNIVCKKNEIVDLEQFDQSFLNNIQDLLDDAVRKINDIKVVIGENSNDSLILTREMNSKIEIIISSSCKMEEQ